jgi:hypothetical protein
MEVKRFKYRFLLNNRKTKLRKGDIAVWEKDGPLRFLRKGQMLSVLAPGRTRHGFIGALPIDSADMVLSVLDLLMAVHKGLNYNLVITRVHLAATFF